MLVLLWHLCSMTLATPIADVIYSDDFSRSKMLPLAAAAYSTQPQKCLSNKFTNAVMERQVYVMCDPVEGDTCSGYSAALIDDKAIVLSFRGTVGFAQLFVEADETVFGNKSTWIAGGKVSKFFNDAFIDLWNGGMKDDFYTLKSRYPSYQVWVTGHSLGGALASLAASYVVAANLTSAASVRLVTFGQPRTGDNEFAVSHDRQMMYSFRITHWRDVIIHLPLEGFENYTHHKYEAFYYSNMKVGAKYKICKANEDIECSDGVKFPTSIYDHLHYFDVHVSAYGKNGCNRQQIQCPTIS